MLASPVYVPPEFFGLVSQDWPNTGSAPTFPVGRLSNYDNNRTHWRSLHTAANTINWANLDTWVAGAKAAGIVRGTYALYGCPTFLASTGAAQAGPYGGLGEGAHPNDLTQLTYFCQQFAARNLSNWGGFFDVVSLFNEPYLSASTTPDNLKFDWSTPAQYVDKLWTAYSALKPYSNLTVLSPGTFLLGSTPSGNFSGIGQWLTTAGAVNTTRHGYDCFDGIAAHPYHAVPGGSGYSGLGDIASLPFGGVNAFRLALAGMQAASGPYHVTEYGVSSSNNWEVTAFLAQTPAYREAFVQCLWIDAMCAGVKSMCAFSLGNVMPLMGSLTTDDPGAVSGLRKVYNACVGKTIVSAYVTAAGGRSLMFSDGTGYLV